MRRGWLVAVVLLAACTAGGDDGRLWPDLTVENLATGGAVSSRSVLGASSGKASVVAVWAVWCEPCRKELPVLQDLARRHPQTLTVAGINHGDDPARAQDFLVELGVDLPSVRDPDGRLVAALEVASLPATFVVDESGRIAWSRVGVVDRSEVEAAVAAVLDGDVHRSS